MAEQAPSPLGRYEALVGAGDGADVTCEIRLLGVPVRVFLAAREHHDALLREFAVMALDRNEESTREPDELRALVREFGVHYAVASARPGDEFEAALQAGKATLDLTYPMPASASRGAEDFERLMDAADRLCEQGLMLTMPRSQVIRDFSAWWFGEVRRQSAGHPPTRWAGPLSAGEGP